MIPFATNATPLASVYLRSNPSTQSNQVGSADPGTVLALAGYTDQGENYQGDSRWWQTVDGHWLTNHLLQVPAGILPVPYHSQWDADASEDMSEDCGPTCVHMLLDYVGKQNITTNAVFEASGEPAGQGISLDGLVRAAANWNMTLSVHQNCTLEQVAQWLQAGSPCIALIHYADIPNKEDSYPGPHFVLVIGLTANHVIINDPDFYNEQRNQGASLAVPRDRFLAAWSDANLDDNPTTTALVLDAPIPTWQLSPAPPSLPSPQPTPSPVPSMTLEQIAAARLATITDMNAAVHGAETEAHQLQNQLHDLIGDKLNTNQISDPITLTAIRATNELVKQVDDLRVTLIKHGYK